MKSSEFLTSPRKVHEHVIRSPEFREQATNRDNLRAGLSHAAFELSKIPDRYTLMQKYQIQLIGQIGPFIDALERLEENKYSSNAEKRKDKEENIIPYNHTLRRMIDANRHLTMPDLTTWVQSSAALTDGPRGARLAKERTRFVLDGMRHEIAAENVFWQIPEASVIEAESDEQEVKDDACGRDLLIEYRGYIVPIDIKASQKGASSALDSQAQNRDRSSMTFPFWSGFAYDDFGNGFRVSDAATESQVERYRAFLDDVIDGHRGALEEAS